MCQQLRSRTTIHRCKVSSRQSFQADSETYAFSKASASISLDVVQNLLDLSIDLLLGPQHLTGFDVQEAEGIDRIESVVEL